MDMFNYANDINLYQEWANLVALDRFTATYSRPYHCAHIGRKWHRNYLHTHDQVLHAWEQSLVHHEAISPVMAQVLGDYAYLVRSPDLRNIQEAMQFILSVA
jgi:hypothetical protein